MSDTQKPTNSDKDKFTFTITDAARFLGKSPVTLRKWEHQKIIIYPRVGDTRIFTLNELRALVKKAYKLKRINRQREQLALASITMLELIERENRCARSARGAENEVC